MRLEVKFILRGGLASAFVLVSQVWAGTVTGNPFADGWTYGGNSLASGVYSQGTANYSYDVYTMASTIVEGSNLDISAGATWGAGDTVLGLGGIFANTITAEAAGWGVGSAFTGNAVNGLYTPIGAGDDLKLQAKFGTTSSNFTLSDLAPGNGNGESDLADGGLGAIQVRTSGSNNAAFWSAGSGALRTLASPSHILRYDLPGEPSPSTDIARIQWIWDTTNQRITSWEILLNISLLERLDSTYAGQITPGGQILATVQNRDGAYTDAVVRTSSLPAAVVPIPAPAAMVILGMGIVGAARRTRRKAAIR